jgi:PAS domain S-box-containing protein
VPVLFKAIDLRLSPEQLSLEYGDMAALGIEMLLMGALGIYFSFRESERAAFALELQTIQSELESRVEQRTSELLEANKQLETEMAERKRVDEELQFAHAQLEKRVEERTAELKDANAILVREISEREQAQAQLRDSEHKFRIISEQSLLGIIFVQDGSTKYVNRAISEIFEQAAEDIESWGPADLVHLVHEDDRCFVMDGLKRDEYEDRDGHSPQTFRVITRSGRTKWVEMRSKTVTLNGRPAKLVTMVDVTERRRGEEMMLEHERVRAVADLAKGVAHNFNNLLQIVVGGAQLVHTRLDEGELQEARTTLDQILESTEFGADTVQRLQQFAQAVSEQAEFGDSVFDLARTLEEAYVMSKTWWKTQAEKRGVKIRFERDLADDCLVMGDENELFEVALNLIKNAAEALTDDGRIEMSLQTVDTDVVFHISDNGSGIPESNLDKVLEPFWTTKGLQGTGMGLADCESKVRRHGGTISLESREGKGTRVTVRLPVAVPVTVSQKDDGVPGAGFEPACLVVDDDPTILSFIESGLTKSHVRVLVASSGDEALELYKKVRVDVVICDLGMPGMNGLQLCDAIRSLCEQRDEPKTPFVLLTGWGDMSAESDSMHRAGVDKVVRKPVRIVDLLHAIQEVVQSREPANP